MTTIGFLGLGRMGEPMALRQAQNGADLTVWSRSSTTYDEMVAAGARVAGSPTEVVERSEVVLVMLAHGQATDAVLGRRPDGFDVPLQDRLVVNMGTVSPDYSRGLADAVSSAGGRFVESPVSGSRVPAYAGELVAMVAGAEADLDVVEPLLGPLTSSVLRCGDVPRATETKLAVNVFLIGMVAALAESVHFAEGRGLDPELLRRVLDAGPMASATSRLKLAKIVEGDGSPQAAAADVLYNNRLILEAAAARGLPMPLLRVCGDLFTRTVDLGLGGQDMVAVLEAIRST